MLLKPYGILEEDYLNPYEQSYVGKVVDNNDPKRLKRVKVLIDIWDYMTDEQLPWVKQQGDGTNGNSPDSSQHNIPEIGSEVRVVFPSKNADDPQYTGMETTEANKCSLFDEDYPNTYGGKDSIGNFTMHNKKTGISVFHHNSGTEVQMDPDGSYTVTSKSGAYVRCDASGAFSFWAPNVTFNVDDKVLVNATRMEFCAQHNIDLNADNINLNGTTSVNAKAPVVNLVGNAVEVPGNMTVGNLTPKNGGSAIITSLIDKKSYIFMDGLLQGEM